MPRAYSGDMRQRVIAEVESGASRREAAEEFEVSASTAIICVKCFRETGRCMPKPRGGSISPLEKHAHFLLDLIEQQPDLTLDEVVLAMHNRYRYGKLAGRSGDAIRHCQLAAVSGDLSGSILRTSNGPVHR
jgi:transposase